MTEGRKKEKGLLGHKSSFMCRTRRLHWFLWLPTKLIHSCWVAETSPLFTDTYYEKSSRELPTIPSCGMENRVTSVTRVINFAV